MKKLLIAVLASLALAACSQNSGKKDGTVVSVPAASQKDEGGQAAKTSSMMPVDPDKVIPEVAEKYSGVLLSVVKKSDNSSTELSVPFAEKVEIKGTPLSVEVLSLFPEFKMVEGGVTNMSMNETNPGAKVKIYKDGKEVFNGWLFQSFPGMHGFDDQEYDIIMVNSVLKK